MKKYLPVFIFTAFFLMFQQTGFAGEIEHTVIYGGFADEDLKSQSFTVTNKESFNNLLTQLNIDPQSQGIDFKSEVAALIVPDDGIYPDQIKIKKVEKSKSGVINVEYFLESFPFVQEKNIQKKKPFLLLKLMPADIDNVQVSFRNVKPNKPIFVNQSIDDSLKYTNILSDQQNQMFINYLPLDKGNSWTYNYETKENNGKQTFSIVSYTQDWSVFDTFFGLSNLAMKIDPEGNLFVSSNKGIRPFYTDDVMIKKQDGPFTVEAGTFNDVLIISSSPQSQIEFKDVYAKDVGLIYHEHNTPKGKAKYSLSSGNIRGRKIP